MPKESWKPIKIFLKGKIPCHNKIILMKFIENNEYSKIDKETIRVLSNYFCDI